MESLDNLTDKTKRFLFEIGDEENRLKERRQELEKTKAEMEALVERNRQLEAIISDLESRRSRFDDKVTTLIDALGEVPLRDIG